tara:strand:- start:4 stop:318 length:315 start_codon:yes stop_codon:yes gene_type:complete
MTRKRIKVSTEEHLSEIHSRKKTGTFSILYTSLWDSQCSSLDVKIDKWLEREGDETLYVINSWDSPAAFSMFMITSVPSLVLINKGRVRVRVEYPTVYRYFDAP